jgi:hypothetical protein
MLRKRGTTISGSPGNRNTNFSIVSKGVDVIRSSEGKTVTNAITNWSKTNEQIPQTILRTNQSAFDGYFRQAGMIFGYW